MCAPSLVPVCLIFVTACTALFHMMCLLDVSKASKSSGGQQQQQQREGRRRREQRDEMQRQTEGEAAALHTATASWSLQQGTTNQRNQVSNATQTRSRDGATGRKRGAASKQWTKRASIQRARLGRQVIVINGAVCSVNVRECSPLLHLLVAALHRRRTALTVVCSVWFRSFQP